MLSIKAAEIPGSSSPEEPTANRSQFQVGECLSPFGKRILGQNQSPDEASEYETNRIRNSKPGDSIFGSICIETQPALHEFVTLAPSS
jgi:hypothetical protein